MEYTDKQRRSLKRSAVVEAGDATLEPPSMARADPDDMDADQLALERATGNEEHPKWGDKMELGSYDSERNRQDIARAQSERENSSDAEHRFQMRDAKEAEGKSQYTGHIAAIKDNHAYQQIPTENGGGYVKHDLDKLTVTKDLGAIRENEAVTINYPTSGGTGIAKKPELEASRDTHQHQANKTADFDRGSHF